MIIKAARWQDIQTVDDQTDYMTDICHLIVTEKWIQIIILKMFWQDGKELSLGNQLDPYFGK